MPLRTTTQRASSTGSAKMIKTLSWAKSSKKICGPTQESTTTEFQTMMTTMRKLRLRVMRKKVKKVRKARRKPKKTINRQCTSALYINRKKIHIIYVYLLQIYTKKLQLIFL